ncbi:MAG: RNA polymerase sigma-54 factor, partial [Pirellulales bacterium]
MGMRLDVSQQMRLEQRMKLAPRMIQSMEILQLPIMALEERIQQEIQENPVLSDDIEADAPPADAAPENSEPAEEAPDATAEEGAEYDEEFERLLTEGDDWREHLASHRVSRGRMEEVGQRKHDAMQNMVSRPESLHEFLLHQFGFFDTSPALRRMGELIIHNIDESGLLDTPLEQLVETLGDGATRELAEEALALVQKLDPPGVGARDLKECLLLQVTPDMPHADVLRTLIAGHLDDLMHNRLPVIQRKTGYSLELIKEARESLKNLNPRPAGNFQPQNIPYVVPDVFVEPDDNGQFHVRLQDRYIPSLHISRRYQQLLRSRETDPQTKQYIQKKIQSARWLIESIEQRRNTLAKV